jgi:uncharacterized membrane protein YhhN
MTTLLNPIYLYSALTLSAVAFTLYCEYILAQSEDIKSARYHRLWWRAAIGKTCASLGFITLFLVLVNRASPAELCAHPWWLGGALVTSAIGDLALIGKSQRCFLVGLGSFLIAHLAFALAFMIPASQGMSVSSLSGGTPWLVTLGALAVTGLASAVAYRKFRPEMPESLRAPSLVYSGVIALMVATAAAHAYCTQCPYVTLGAIAFWLSDLAVAQQRFRGHLLPLQGFHVRLWGLPLYYIAQLILAAEPSRYLGH